MHYETKRSSGGQGAEPTASRTWAEPFADSLQQIRKWHPGTVKLVAIADYFHVSVDAILGREPADNLPPALDDSLVDLLINWLFVKCWGTQDSQRVKCGHGSCENCGSQRQYA